MANRIKDIREALKLSQREFGEKLDEAIGIFKTLRPEFQDYALEQLRRLAELQEKKTD